MNRTKFKKGSEVAIPISPRDLIPPALLLAAVLVWALGALDRPGFEGAGRGLAIGAAVCAPVWLIGLWRRSREAARRDDRE